MPSSPPPPSPSFFLMFLLVLTSERAYQVKIYSTNNFSNLTITAEEKQCFRFVLNLKPFFPGGADYAVNWLSWASLLSHTAESCPYSCLSCAMHGMQSGLTCFSASLSVFNMCLAIYQLVIFLFRFPFSIGASGFLLVSFSPIFHFLHVQYLL